MFVCDTGIVILEEKKKQQVPSTFFAKTAGYWSLVEETLALLVKSFLRRSSVTFICSRAAISNSTIGLFGYRFCKGEKKNYIK